VDDINALLLSLTINLSSSRLVCGELSNVIEIWTDGSCRRNPGPGGYAALIIDGHARWEVTGFAQSTTNNRMELTAAREGIAAAPTDKPATLYTDSTYVLIGARVIHSGKPRLKVNTDLWIALLQVACRRTAPIIWAKVKAHSGIAHNEYVDRLAAKAAIAL
jgi:ribonuclease HI